MSVIVPERLAQLDTLTLQHGSHVRFDGGHCAMEVVDWLTGAHEHGISDRPACTCPVIAAVVREWNDALPDDASRTRLLLPLVPELVGTRYDDDSVLLRRMWIAVDWQIRVYTPAWLRRAGLVGYAERLEALREIKDLIDLEEATEVCQAAESAARSAAESAARSAARSAAESAAWSAAYQEILDAILAALPATATGDV